MGRRRMGTGVDWITIAQLGSAGAMAYAAVVMTRATRALERERLDVARRAREWAISTHPSSMTDWDHLPWNDRQ